MSILYAQSFKTVDSTRGIIPSKITLTPEFSPNGTSIQSFLKSNHIKRPRVALVLSGGGARGVASVGILKVLERNHIPIDIIVGTSIGCIVGGLYASGYTTQELEEIVKRTNWEYILSFSDEARRRDMFLDQKTAEDRSILTLRFEGFEPIIPPALSEGQRVTHFLNLLTLQSLYHPKENFNELRTHFRAVTSDLVSGKRIVIDRGDLTEAMRASVAVPLLFNPVTRDTMQLLDGGLVTNVPVDVAKNLGYDIIIAADVTSPLRPRDKLSAPWEQADQIMGIMMQLSNKLQLQNADVVIRPQLGNHLSSDFTNLDFLISAGEIAADSLIPQIREAIVKKDLQMHQTINQAFRGIRLISSDTTAQFLWKHFNTAPFCAPSLCFIQHFVNNLYATGIYDSVRANVSTSNDSAIVSLTLAPNPVLTSVEFNGIGRVAPETLIVPFKPLLGNPINHYASRIAMEEMLRIYRRIGYSLARIRSVEYNRTTGRAIINIDEGLIYRCSITGTEKTKDFIIWREVPISAGEVFHISNAEKGLYNLYGSNLFEQVLIALKQEQGKQSIIVNVKERNTELIRFGIRLDNERYFQPSIDIRNENLLGIGSEIGLHFSGGSRNLNLIGDFKTTRIFKTYLTFNFKVYGIRKDINLYEQARSSDVTTWSRTRVGEYRIEKGGTSFEFGAQLERLGVLTVEGRFESHRISNIYSDKITDESFRLAQFRVGTHIDSQDRFPFPRSGVVSDLYFESPITPSKEFIGYTKFFVNYGSFHTYARSTIHPKVLFGFADVTLPLSEQFSLGGKENFYGLNEEDRTGRQLLIASLEYRYFIPVKILFDSYVSVRYDIGSCWITPEQIKLQDLRHGVGIGLSFETPIGPAYISLGKSFYFRQEPLDRPVSFGPLKVYFSIGYPIQ